MSKEFKLYWAPIENPLIIYLDKLSVGNPKPVSESIASSWILTKLAPILTAQGLSEVCALVNEKHPINAMIRNICYFIFKNFKPIYELF